MRKSQRTALFAFCIFFTVIALSQSSQWKEYVYAEDGFAILSPREPEIQKHTLPVKMGEVEAHMYRIPLENYLVVIMYIPFHPDDKRTWEQALTDAKEALSKSGAKLISEKPILLEKYPGVEIEVEDARYHQQGRFYIAERKMYAVTASTLKGKAFTQEIQRWFDSFRLVEPKKQ
jgi:hypothetical protein